MLGFVKNNNKYITKSSTPLRIVHSARVHDPWNIILRTLWTVFSLKAGDLQTFWKKIAADGRTKWFVHVLDCASVESKPFVDVLHGVSLGSRWSICTCFGLLSRYKSKMIYLYSVRVSGSAICTSTHHLYTFSQKHDIYFLQHASSVSYIYVNMRSVQQQMTDKRFVPDVWFTINQPISNRYALCPPRTVLFCDFSLSLPFFSRACIF